MSRDSWAIHTRFDKCGINVYIPILSVQHTIGFSNMSGTIMTGLPVFIEIIIAIGAFAAACWAIIRLLRAYLEWVRGEQPIISSRVDSIESRMKVLEESIHRIDVESAGHNISDLKDRIHQLEQKIDKLTTLLIEQQMMMRTMGMKPGGGINDGS